MHRYKITGVQLGETKAVFNAGRAEKLVKSAPATIQVSKHTHMHVASQMRGGGRKSRF